MVFPSFMSFLDPTYREEEQTQTSVDDSNQSPKGAKSVCSGYHSAVTELHKNTSQPVKVHDMKDGCEDVEVEVLSSAAVAMEVVKEEDESLVQDASFQEEINEHLTEQLAVYLKDKKKSKKMSKQARKQAIKKYLKKSLRTYLASKSLEVEEGHNGKPQMTQLQAVDSVISNCEQDKEKEKNKSKKNKTRGKGKGGKNKKEYQVSSAEEKVKLMAENGTSSLTSPGLFSLVNHIQSEFDRLEKLSRALDQKSLDKLSQPGDDDDTSSLNTEAREIQAGLHRTMRVVQNPSGSNGSKEPPLNQSSSQDISSSKAHTEEMLSMESESHLRDTFSVESSSFPQLSSKDTATFTETNRGLQSASTRDDNRHCETFTSQSSYSSKSVSRMNPSQSLTSQSQRQTWHPFTIDSQNWIKNRQDSRDILNTTSTSHDWSSFISKSQASYDMSNFRQSGSCFGEKEGLSKDSLRQAGLPQKSWSDKGNASTRSRPSPSRSAGIDDHRDDTPASMLTGRETETEEASHRSNISERQASEQGSANCNLAEKQKELDVVLSELADLKALESTLKVKANEEASDSWKAVEKVLKRADSPRPQTDLAPYTNVPHTLSLSRQATSESFASEAEQQREIEAQIVAELAKLQAVQDAFVRQLNLAESGENPPVSDKKKNLKGALLSRKWSSRSKGANKSKGEGPEMMAKSDKSVCKSEQSRSSNRSMTWIRAELDRLRTTHAEMFARGRALTKRDMHAY